MISEQRHCQKKKSKERSLSKGRKQKKKKKKRFRRKNFSKKKKTKNKFSKDDQEKKKTIYLSPYFKKQHEAQKHNDKINMLNSIKEHLLEANRYDTDKLDQVDEGPDR